MACISNTAEEEHDVFTDRWSGSNGLDGDLFLSKTCIDKPCTAASFWSKSD